MKEVAQAASFFARLVAIRAKLKYYGQDLSQAFSEQRHE